ncbi:MAG: hypothetical protein WBW11_16375, partial [Pseudolabrys sp.]
YRHGRSIATMGSGRQGVRTANFPDVATTGLKKAQWPRRAATTEKLGGHVMWKVAVVQPVTEGFGFNITTETNVQLVSFAYATRAEAEAGATHAQAVVEKAVSVLPIFNPQPRRRWWAVILDYWNR